MLLATALYPLRSLYYLASLLFLYTPDNSLSASIIIRLVRIITFSLILRTYLAPWILVLVSDRIRIRSISLRSIRGIYFRKGAHTWKIDRIGYVFSTVQGSRRLAIKIDGASLHISQEEAQVVKPKTRHTRNLTLADLNPSPIVGYAWKLISAIVGALEPYVRPLVRTSVIACIRVAVQWLPAITSRLSFDLQSVTITFSGLSETKIVAEGISLNTALDIVYLEENKDHTHAQNLKDGPSLRSVQGVSMWKRRLADGFQRSFDKALGESRGTATLALKVGHVLGTMPRPGKADGRTVPFLVSNGLIDFGMSAKFNPREGALEQRGLEISLSLGDCSAKVDLLNMLLSKAFPKKARPAHPIPPPLSSLPASYGGDTPLSSPFAWNKQQSPSLASAPPTARSFASSLFSPMSVFSGKTSLLSPNSANPMSPSFPRSPSSPFFKAISASMRPRHRFLLPPVKLVDHKDKSKLLILHSVQLSLGSISLSILSEAESGPYTAVIKDIKADLSISDPSSNPLHQTYLGSRRRRADYESDPYSLKVSMSQISLERDVLHHTTRLARMGSFELRVLAFQWPTPFLSPSPFMGNDANAPFLAVRLKLASIHMTDRIQDLQRILHMAQEMQKNTVAENAPPSLPPPSSLNPPPSLPVPRIFFTFECGPIVGRIIYDAENGQKHRAIELRNNGLVLSLESAYKHPPALVKRFFPAASSVQALLWDATLSLNVEPILVRVRSTHNFVGQDEPMLRATDEDFLEDPPILSVGMVDISITANAIAQMDGAAESIAVIDTSTLLFEPVITYEAILVELWHPISVDAALRLISLIPSSVEKPPTSNPSPVFSRLPVGVSAKLSIARFVVFITAPDISPTDNLDLSRGFAFRTSVSLEYCSLRMHQDHWFNNVKRSQSRTKLRLPLETITDALVSSKAFNPLGDKSSFLKVGMNNTVFRAAVATQFEPDEPGMVGREDVADPTQELLRINRAQADICLAYKAPQSEGQDSGTDICQVSVDVPLVRLDFRLAHVYSVLLGLQTIVLIKPPRQRKQRDPMTSSVPNQRHITYSLQGNVTAVQGVISLPIQKLILRMDGLSGHANGIDSPRIKISKTAVYTLLPPKVNKWEAESTNKWDHFLTLQTWEITFTKLAGSLCVSIDGDSARFRIPHGFVLADLVQDASVSAKAIKHMIFMASAGCYSDMPSPAPEGPKSVPHLTIRLRSLSAEAQDDPFESKLGMLWREGAEASQRRMEREEAFKVKVAAVLADNQEMQYADAQNSEHAYQFDTRHTVSIDEARQRLDDVHFFDWHFSLEKAIKNRVKAESSFLHTLYGTSIPMASDSLLEFMELPQGSSDPPLLRLLLQDLCLTISPPSFSIESLPDVLHDLGSGLPRDTEFSLLVPLHVHFTLSTLAVTLRDYPLPLVNISSETSSIAWAFDTDLIIGEEMGSEKSVDWVVCPIIEAEHAKHGEAPFSITVPKTIMPVKTYAAPIIKVTTPEASIFSWGVSYGPAIQDVMRIVDTLSSAPRDPSPSVGFWDKLRLVFHWTVKISFTGDIRLYIKGSRDPHQTYDDGAGFVLCWQGSPEIRVGYENQQKELIQVASDGMVIAVPNIKNGVTSLSTAQKSKPFQKICARLSSGVRFGIGFVLERSCGLECSFCTGSPFHRKCRYFSFDPHYRVRLEKKSSPPTLKGAYDSYNGFRSDFIHLSVSLASCTKVKGLKGGPSPSNIYLTPKIFAHFWSWCALFDGVLTLPIRQGKYHPSRPISPKLGRHLATIKYRISLSHLYIMHGYIDDSRETWVDGVTPWVGLKGKVDELQADLHQREEESTVPGPIPDTTRLVRKKPFYAAEVIMKGLELRAMLASFQEPMKQRAEMSAPPQRSNYRKHTDLPVTSPNSIWYDLDDFMELGWSATEHPTLHLLPLATCPHFTYFKKNAALSGSMPQASKFGLEHSHTCLLGKEPSVPNTQISLANNRVKELRQLIESRNNTTSNPAPLKKMVTLIEEYISMLKGGGSDASKATESYRMPADIVSSDEWAEFDNVYQIHCPTIVMNSAIRDIMVQYYYCSRDRRGFEYHMATRAVKFIRDQANAALTVEREDESSHDRPSNTAQLAATALRKILRGDNSTKISVDLAREKNGISPGEADPLEGWSEGVILQKSNCCLLLKPQIVLRGDTPADSCIVAAGQAKALSYNIMDSLNQDDPVSGKIMSRNYTSLSGLQAFAPTKIGTTDGSVPLEVLIDLRCESDAFERLVPQTEATFRYDKFNRLRLRNNVTSNVTKNEDENSSLSESHLQNQTDLIRVHIPRFTVSANTEHFQAISNIVTKLLLFSDPAHKTRLDKLETLIFTYDFTDLRSAANVVASLQSRLRDALEAERSAMRKVRDIADDDTQLRLIQLKAHIFSLSEELNLLFDSIKMAQDRYDDQSDQKSALLLHASSSEISWRMLDARRNLLSKIVVADINFHWLSRQDSSTVNHLTIGDLTAFDGSRYAIWAEILSKYTEPPNHPLLKRGLFLAANWTILAPVGGITIYEVFEMSLHPIRLQVDAKVGRRIMEYVWPDRKAREQVTGLEDPPHQDSSSKPPPEITVKSPMSGRSSMDSPRIVPGSKQLSKASKKMQGPTLRKLGSSRSFTDLRSAREDDVLSPPPMSPPAFLTTPGFLSPPAFLKRTHSTDSVNFASLLEAPATPGPKGIETNDSDGLSKSTGDAQVMKTRSSQKTFVLVKISSLHLLLSVVKEGSFECHDAKIKTRELEYRNQTWSFEELVNQFIPSNMSWRGWVKMAFHQPLVPVLPVARELLAKTKWTASKSSNPHDNPLRLLHPRAFGLDDDRRLNSVHMETTKKSESPSKSPWKNALRSGHKEPTPTVLGPSTPLTAEPEQMEFDVPEAKTPERPPGRRRVKSLFGSRSNSKSRGPEKRKSSERL
ncbi:hypothetical protein CPC08DRAFT_812902 [Agrocybe pediades]|nr:hypothetical protein CPC08DRAFT_812902 [Agrocybe pediades]